MFLRTLDTFAVYVTRQSTRRQKFFRKRNIALAIQKRSNSFTFIAKDENNFLDIQTADGEVTSQNSLATFFVPQSLLTRAKNSQIYSYIYRSGLFFSLQTKNEQVQSVIMAVTVPDKKISNLQDPVVINFQDQNTNEEGSKKISTCQFWVPGRNGIWCCYPVFLCFFVTCTVSRTWRKCISFLNGSCCKIFRIIASKVFIFMRWISQNPR